MTKLLQGDQSHRIVKDCPGHLEDHSWEEEPVLGQGRTLQQEQVWVSR
ncbi:MAG: hypothetical protein AAGA46_08900 [Cyanobacteria bacterium P01_F01_bin.13]